MLIDDRRSPEQADEMTAAVVATDLYETRERGAPDYCAWACKPDDLERVFDWVERRGDMRRLRPIQDLDAYSKRLRIRPGRLTIYPVHPEHPAKTGAPIWLS